MANDPSPPFAPFAPATPYGGLPVPGVQTLNLAQPQPPYEPESSAVQVLRSLVAERRRQRESVEGDKARLLSEVEMYEKYALSHREKAASVDRDISAIDADITVLLADIEKLGGAAGVTRVMPERELRARVRAGLDPAPICPYKSHEPSARCPNCKGWPHYEPDYARAVVARAKDAGLPVADYLRAWARLPAPLPAEKTARLAASYSEGPGSFAATLKRYPRPRVRREQICRVGTALVMVAAAVAIMWAEGTCRPDPGAGWAIAAALLVGSVFILGRPKDG